MSDTIWFMRQSQVSSEDAGDDFDHSLFCKYADALDAAAVALGVPKLSEFFDTTDLQFNFSEDELPESWIADNQTWHPTAQALAALRSVITNVKISAVKGVPKAATAELLEELTDCEIKLAAADAAGDMFHFSVVG